MCYYFCFQCVYFLGCYFVVKWGVQCYCDDLQQCVDCCGVCGYGYVGVGYCCCNGNLFLFIVIKQLLVKFGDGVVGYDCYDVVWSG